MLYDRKKANTLYQYKFRWYKWCVYCGCQAQEIDHVYPVSLIRNLDTTNPRVFRHLRHVLYMVPACSDCNRIAGNKPFLHIKEKRAWIQKEISRKYKKILRCRIWDEEELSEVKGNVRREIIKAMRNRLILEHRISYPHYKTTVPLSYAT